MAVKKDADESYGKFYDEIVTLMNEQSVFIDDAQIELAKADAIDKAEAFFSIRS